MPSDARPIRFQRPWMPSAEAIEQYFAAAREARWFSNRGPCWHRLRGRLEERTGVACVPVANATVGLMAAIAALRVDARTAARTVLLPSFTFAAAVHAVRLAGLQPAFVDVDEAHWHLDPDRLDDALAHDGIALVLACSSFGTPPLPAVRRRWEDACADRGVPLILDSAAGFGATAADGVPIGAQGTVEIVSFHATKPFAIGEGGAVFTRDTALAARVERIVNFGFDEHRHVSEPVAFNGKMSEAHAAVGLAVFDELDDILERRSGAARQIRAAAPPQLTFQEGCECSTWQFVPVAACDGVHRDSLLHAARGLVELRTYYEPLHLMPAFAAIPAFGPLDSTEALGARMVSLPMANDLSSDEIAAIVQAVTTDDDAHRQEDNRARMG